MAGVEFSPEALLDIEEIEFQGAIQFGLPQATKYQNGMFRVFELIGQFPLMGSALSMKRNSNWRRFAYGAHVIFYSVEPDKVMIRRVLHGRQDLFRHLESRTNACAAQRFHNRLNQPN